MPKITTFAEANERLREYWPSRISRHAYTLDYTYQLMEHLGNPQETFKIVHVAGTSGKTSTAYYTAALLQAAGKKVGLTVSPHVDEVNERVQINLTPMPEAEFCRELSDFLQIVEDSGIKTTYFELLTAFMYWEFARQGVDYAVVEVGLGGLLDATNVVSRADKVCVITDIGLDHMRVLGQIIPEIAFQKAGIIQLHNPIFCYRQAEEIMDVIRRMAIKKQADLHTIEPSNDASFDFLPLFQQRNFGLALYVVQFVLARDNLPELPIAQIEKAAHTYVPGRMETLSIAGKTLIMDGAHNAQKMHALVESIRIRYPDQPVAVLLSFVAEREGRVESGITELSKIAHDIIITTFEGGQDTPHGSVDPKDIVAACEKVHFTAHETVPDIKAAVTTLLKRPEPILLVTGSFYMLSHVRPLLKKHTPAQ